MCIRDRDLIFRTFCEPGEDEVILLPPTYGMYGVLAKLNNVKAVNVPLNQNFELDIPRIMSSINQKTKVIFVCSPNNPTGNAIPQGQIKNLLDQFSGLIVVDEAYIDFSKTATAIELMNDYPNLMICQTFSKAYGLAGIRLGIGFAKPEIINFFSFASSFGAFNLVQGNLRAGPNCSNMCFIPVCPPAR